MIELFIVDYHNLYKTNGLTTYVNQIEEYLRKSPYIKLHYIWLNCNTIKFEKKLTGTITNYFLPGNLSVANDTSGFDEKAVKYLASEMADKKNIIVHFNWINHCPFAFLLKKVISFKAILTQHCTPWKEAIIDNYPSFYNANRTFSSRQEKLNVLSPLLQRELLSYLAMDHIVCVSAIGRQSLRKMLNYPSEKISVIYNGIRVPSVDIQDGHKQSLRKQYGISKNEIIILFAGSVAQKKGIFDLVKVFNTLVSEQPTKKLRLIIAGKGDYNKLMEGVHGNWLKITVTGHLSKKDLYNFYMMADIGIVPSYVEPFGYCALEMMYFGLPIIVSDVDGLKEIVPDNCGLKVQLVLSKNRAFINEGQLIEKIKLYLNDKKLAKNLAINARAHACKNFTAQRMTEELIGVYQKLAQNQETFSNIEPIGCPMVSVLLPYQSVDPYLHECIYSILKQTYVHFELCLIDIGKGNIDHVANKYADKRIRHIKDEKINDTSSAINYGIKMAKGKYIARIDPHSLMHPQQIQEQVSFLEDSKNSDIAIVGSNHYLIDSTGKIFGLKQYPEADKVIKTFMVFQPAFHPSTIMFRSDVIKKFRYTNKYRFAEDYELWFKISEKHKLGNLQEYLSYTRAIPSENLEENIKEKRTNTIELLSEQLDRLGLEHTQRELAIHIAIIFGYGKRYFNTPQKQKELKTWIKKVLDALKIKNKISNSMTQSVFYSILENYCRI